MCCIYYPYFKIEAGRTGRKYDHKINLVVLSLFCDKILIPARDLLIATDDEFDVLLHFKVLFQEAIIESRIPDEVFDLGEYYDKIKGDIDVDNKILDARMKRIIDELGVPEDKIGKYRILEQQGYYSQKIKEFIADYKKKSKSTGLRELREAWKRDEIVTKEKFDKTIDEIRVRGGITTSIFNELKMASDEISFIAGASSGHIKVCYDNYFDKKSVAQSMEKIIADYHAIVNKGYSPENIIHFLKEMGVIDSERELMNLTIHDIVLLRTHPCFKKFVKVYEQYSVNETFSKLRNKRMFSFKTIYKIKDIFITALLSVITSIIGFVIAKKIIAAIAFGLLSIPIAWAANGYIKNVRGNEIPVFESIFDKLMGCFDPISLFLAKLKWRVEWRRL